MGIETINTVLIGGRKRMFIVQVLIKAQYLEAKQSDKVFAGTCSGKLKNKGF